MALNKRVRQKSHRPRQGGYTLTEMMITVAIVGVLSAVSAPILVQITNFWRQTTARYEIERDVRVGLDTIDRMLRQAQSGSITVDQLTGQPPYSRINFTTIQGQNIWFYQQGNLLYMNLNGAVSVLSKRIGYIAFSYPKTDDNTIMSVAITVQSPTYLGVTKALQLSVQKVRIMN